MSFFSQAQESPEPVYDISECGLKNVPQGVFSKCKVLRKEALLLQVRRKPDVEDVLRPLNTALFLTQDNELRELGGGGSIADMAEVLQVLDLHGNHLDKLPEEIGMLKQLRVSECMCCHPVVVVIHACPRQLGELERPFSASPLPP